MTDEEILQLVKQAWKETGRDYDAGAWFRTHLDSFKRFAALVIKHKREHHTNKED